MDSVYAGEVGPLSARAQSLRHTLDRVANSLAASNRAPPDLQLERAHSDPGLPPQPHPARSTMEVIDRVLWVRGAHQPDAPAARCGTGCTSKLSPLVRAVEACSPPCVHADLDGARARPPSIMSLPTEYLVPHAGDSDTVADPPASPTITCTAAGLVPPSAVDAAIKSIIEGQHGRGAERMLKSVMKRAVPRVSSTPAAPPPVAPVACSEEGGEGGEGAASEGASTPPSPFSSPTGSRPASPPPARRKVSFADEGDKPAPLTYTRYIASRSAADVAAAAFAAVGGSMPSFYKKMLSKPAEATSPDMRAGAPRVADEASPPHESERGSSTRDAPPKQTAAANNPWNNQDDETETGEDALGAVTPAKAQQPALGNVAAGSSDVASPPSGSLSPPMSPTALRIRLFGSTSSAGSCASSHPPSSSVAAPVATSAAARAASPEAAAPVPAPVAAPAAAPAAAPVVAATPSALAGASAATVVTTPSFSQKLAAQSAALERTVTLPSFYKRMLSRLQEAEPAVDATSAPRSDPSTSGHAMPTSPGWLPASNTASSAAPICLPTCAANASHTKVVPCDIAGGELL